MFNFLGKVLVLVHTFLSLLVMIWALSLFMNATDWGFINPREDLGQRIASEFDKSAVAVSDAIKMRDRAVVNVAAAQASLRETEQRFAFNHLYYVAELKRLRTAPEPIEVKAIKAGVLPLDTPGKEIGKPVLDAKVEGIDQSYQTYVGNLKMLEAQIDKVETEKREVIEESKKVTFQLTGKDDAGKRVRIGLYELIDKEYQIQQGLRQEKEYLQPQWAQALEEARLFRLRRQSLETTLSRFQQQDKK
jgi:hypothetical protein